MPVPFLLLLIQWFTLWFTSVSAQQSCSSFFEFAVDNCTACPTLDHTRGDVRMAVCEERAAATGNGTAYACVCLDYPGIRIASSPLMYYPHVEGNVTRCANSWPDGEGVFHQHGATPFTVDELVARFNEMDWTEGMAIAQARVAVVPVYASGDGIAATGGEDVTTSRHSARGAVLHMFLKRQDAWCGQGRTLRGPHVGRAEAALDVTGPEVALVEWVTQARI